jgi:hypothetical protein
MRIFDITGILLTWNHLPFYNIQILVNYSRLEIPAYEAYSRVPQLKFTTIKKLKKEKNVKKGKKKEIYFTC